MIGGARKGGIGWLRARFNDDSEQVDVVKLPIARADLPVGGVGCLLLDDWPLPFPIGGFFDLRKHQSALTDCNADDADSWPF